MFEFTKILNHLYPSLHFQWLGGRFVWVAHTELEYNPSTGETTKAYYSLGCIMRLHASPCWVAFDDTRGESEWQSRVCYSTQAAVEELWKHTGRESNLRHNAEVNALVRSAEEKLLRQDEKLGVHS